MLNEPARQPTVVLSGGVIHSPPVDVVSVLVLAHLEKLSEENTRTGGHGQGVQEGEREYWLRAQDRDRMVENSRKQIIHTGKR